MPHPLPAVGGMGNSHSFTTAIRTTMIADAVTAATDLAEQRPESAQVVLGERVGALVAAEVAIAVTRGVTTLPRPSATATTPPPGCTVDLFQFGRKSLDPKYAKLLAAWEDATARSHLVDEAEIWWFAPGPWKRGEEGRPVTLAVLDATVPVIEKMTNTRSEVR